MKSKLGPAILVGAVVGAAISLLDKGTREQTKQSALKVKDTVSYYAQNRDELQALVTDKVSKVQSLYSSAEQNIQSFLGEGTTNSSLPETISTLISEAKDTFSSK